MNLQYVENFADGKVVLLVYGAIGGDEGVNGARFAEVINYLQHEPAVHEIEVRINSHGGVVLDALNIFNAIRGSKKPCNTVIDGIAASSGGLVAMAGHKRMINDFGRLMVHAPQLSDKVRVDLDENVIKMLDQFQDLIADLLTANSRHEKAQINAMISAETWFTADQALADGFVDEVLNTDRDFTEIFNELDLANADLALVVNQISNHKNVPKMETIKNTLGLDSSVSEQVVNTAISKIVNAKDDAEKALLKEQNAHKATKDALDVANVATKEVNDAAATAYVENAIKDGKFKPEQKEILTAQAIENLGDFKAICKSIATPAKRITDTIDTEGDAKKAKAGEVVNGKLDGKTFREIEKDAPQVLAQLLVNEPTKHAELYAAQYPKA